MNNNLALGLLLMAPVWSAADSAGPIDLANRYATCAAYYFNAVNTKPMQEYEAIYGAGERSFNEAIKLVGRQQVDHLMEQAAGAMTKLMNSDWNNFRSVEHKYGTECDRLVGAVAR